MVIGFDIKMKVKISSIEIVFKSWGPLSHPFFMPNILSTTGARDMAVQRVPALRGFWDLKKTVLCKIHISGTVEDPLLTRKSPTCTYISRKPW